MNTHLHIELRLRLCGVVLPLPVELNPVIWQRKTFLFLFDA
jgi:hypothetical protein